MDIINNAESFYYAAQRCLEPRIINENSFQILMTPAIVNASFAAELYLKSLLIKSNRVQKGHDLKILFDALKNEHKDIIRQKFNSVHKSFVSDVNNSNLTEDDLNIFNEKFNKSFDEILEYQSKSFVEWRYLHEKPINSDLNNSIQLYFSICDACSEIINNFA